MRACVMRPRWGDREGTRRNVPMDGALKLLPPRAAATAAMSVEGGRVRLRREGEAVCERASERKVGRRGWPGELAVTERSEAGRRG